MLLTNLMQCFHAFGCYILTCVCVYVMMYVCIYKLTLRCQILSVHLSPARTKTNNKVNKRKINNVRNHNKNTVALKISFPKSRQVYVCKHMLCVVSGVGVGVGIACSKHQAAAVVTALLMLHFGSLLNT